MPRTYKRKTSWGSTALEKMERAANDVKGGKSIRSVAKETNIDRSTLRRHMKKREANKNNKKIKTVGYGGTAEAKRVFSDEVAGKGASRPHQEAQVGRSLTIWLMRWTGNRIHVFENNNYDNYTTVKATLKNFRFSLIMAAPVDKSGSVLPEGRLHFP